MAKNKNVDGLVQGRRLSAFYRPHKRVSINFDQSNPLYVSKTKQSARDECDINRIVERARRGLGVSHVSSVPAVFGEMTQTSLLESHVMMEKAEEAFMSLSAKIRERFYNDPVKLLEFIGDDRNYEEAVRLGLVERKQEPGVVTPPAATSASKEEPPK